MRIESTSPAVFSLGSQLSEQGWHPKTWSSSLSSLASPSKIFARMKFYLLAPFTYLRAFFSPETFPIVVPGFPLTGTKSPNESALKKELQENESARSEDSFLFVGNFELEEKVLLLDQFDKIISYVEEIASSNFGEVEASIRFDGSSSCNLGNHTADKFSSTRARFLKILKAETRRDVQFVLEIKYHFSSWFGERYENIKHTVVVKTGEGIQFI